LLLCNGELNTNNRCVFLADIGNYLESCTSVQWNNMNGVLNASCFTDIGGSSISSLDLSNPQNGCTNQSVVSNINGRLTCFFNPPTPMPPLPSPPPLTPPAPPPAPGILGSLILFHHMPGYSYSYKCTHVTISYAAKQDLVF